MAAPVQTNSAPTTERALRVLLAEDHAVNRRVVELMLADFDGDRYRISAAGWPQGTVDPAYINPRWIPLTHDGSGNHIGLDFDPWPEGRHGQVILYGRDEDVKAVLAPSLGAFLEWIAGLIMLRETGMSIADVRQMAVLSRIPGTESDRLSVLEAHRQGVLIDLDRTRAHLAALEKKMSAYRDAINLPNRPAHEPKDVSL